MSRNTKKIIYKIVKDRLIVQYVRDGIIYATEDHWVFQSRTLIEDSEKSTTPFGDHSTYGRYTELDNAVLLLIHTNSTSIVHRIQEVVSMPNLFLENLRSAKGYDSGQSIKEYEVRVHTPVIPLYVIVEG